MQQISCLEVGASNVVGLSVVESGFMIGGLDLNGGLSFCISS